MARIYGRVTDVQDIARINCIIRDEMLTVEDEAQLTDLKKRSDYLCTLTYSPFWKKKFGDKIEELRQKACEENKFTVKTANVVAKYKGFDKEYHPWGVKEEQIEEELKKIPESVIHELTESFFTLELSARVLEDLRRSFCEIRKAVVVCEDRACLDKMKRAVDILSALPYTEFFRNHFDDTMMKKIDKLILTEKERSVKLLNMTAFVNGMLDVLYESIDENDFDVAENYIEKLLEEEEKADTYVPTEVKYKGNARVMWLVYYHPKRKRNYAKRIYFPADFKIMSIEGPDEFKNKFGNPVYGIRVEYLSPVRETVIKVRAREIHLPERWMRRVKVIPVPRVAQQIRLTEEKPAFAMDIS